MLWHFSIWKELFWRFQLSLGCDLSSIFSIFSSLHIKTRRFFSITHSSWSEDILNGKVVFTHVHDVWCERGNRQTFWHINWTNWHSIDTTQKSYLLFSLPNPLDQTFEMFAPSLYPKIYHTLTCAYWCLPSKNQYCRKTKVEKWVRNIYGISIFTIEHWKFNIQEKKRLPTSVSRNKRF